MKKAGLLSFSDRGRELAGRIAEALSSEYETVCVQPRGDLSEITGKLFAEYDALVFVGACGIAVRAVAPYVVSKTSDPAVIVVDERGEHAISLLSGHIGGANELTLRIAEAIGAEPVITTATDVNRRFSVDAWAAKQGLLLDSMDTAKIFSAEILKRDLPLYSELPMEGALPAGLFYAQSGDLGAAVSYRTVKPFRQTLRLTPLCLHLGIGCRRGTSAEQIRHLVEETLKEYDIDPQAVADVSSIDVKADEEGLLAFAKELGVPARFYSAEELQQVPGDFSPSAFVQSKVGVDNVCERAAVKSAGEGAKLIIRKTAADGVTVAVAQENRRIRFE
ncbi:MAG: cobalt-precorrin 5A hydrolase [Firmicutes bacterium]|nr:cobalt-precorrin 5A hydrolase [Bacillota bacterium]MBQ6295778.1 cobalt-precorrin 5A hydrolase [Bacillota bacterium]